MLKHTFCHISGIGMKTEKTLWDAGLTDWRIFLNQCDRVASIPRKEIIRRSVDASMGRLALHDAGFFAAGLPAKEQWRLFPDFRDRLAYIDIETTGLDDYCEITTIALYNGSTVQTYVNGRNLEDFVQDIEAYAVVVTYNGKCFDVPFIERFFRIQMHQAHIDLRYVLKSLGFGGGLKGCERQMGIDRGNLNGVDGFFAVRLWEDYIRRNNEYALETLLRYNIEDVINLEMLMVKAYNLKIEKTPFKETLALAEPEPVYIPVSAHMPTLDRLRGAAFY